MILLIVVKVEEEERHCFKPSWGGVETVTGFIFLGSKITADGTCSHEIKKCLPLGRKVMTAY